MQGKLLQTMFMNGQLWDSEIFAHEFQTFMNPWRKIDTDKKVPPDLHETGMHGLRYWSACFCVIHYL